MSSGTPGDGAEHKGVPAIKKTARLIVAGEQGLSLGLHVVDGQVLLTLNGLTLKDAEDTKITIEDGYASVSFRVKVADGQR